MARASSKTEVKTEPVNDLEARKKAVAESVAQIEKKYGKGAVIKLGDKPRAYPHLSTGILSLDIAVGIGGLPKGRIIEIYGPESAGKTLIALQAVAATQKAGGLCAFIDAEHALNVQFAENIGVNVEDLYVCQPDDGETGMEIAESLIRSGGMSLIVIDSVAALTPRAEIEGEMTDQQMGLQARLLSKALRKINAVVSKTDTTVIFINQLREKIGIMFGCLHADTLVNFTDGRSIPIKKVVEEKIQGKVWSYNEELHIFEEKEIIDWHYNGDVENQEDYIHIETQGYGGNSRFGFTVTPNHEVLTKEGWKQAKDLSFEDKIITKVPSFINESLADFMWGSFIGDSGVQIRSKSTATFKLQDNENLDYLNWKLSKLPQELNMHKNAKRYESQYLSELALIKDELGERNPLAFFNNHYSDLGLAIWYMDDGNYESADSHSRAAISVKRFKGNESLLNEIAKCFESKGLSCKVNIKNGSFSFNKENTKLLFDKIAKYIPECMQYKLDDDHKNKYEDFSLTYHHDYITHYTDITMIRNASKSQMKQKGKYDITVKDNHNYMVGGNNNGIIVHNSPETTTGGRALKFYSSVRLDVRKVDSIKQGGEIVGNRVKVKVVKNKMAAPMKEAQFDLMFASGASHTGALVDFGAELDIIEKAGAWYSYNGEKIGQGRENAKQFLEENPDVAAVVQKAIYEHYGIIDNKDIDPSVMTAAQPDLKDLDSLDDDLI